MFSICIFEGDVHRAYGQIRYGGERWARERVKDDSEVWPELLTDGEDQEYGGSLRIKKLGLRWCV